MMNEKRKRLSPKIVVLLAIIISVSIAAILTYYAPKWDTSPDITIHRYLSTKNYTAPPIPNLSLGLKFTLAATLYNGTHVLVSVFTLDGDTGNVTDELHYLFKIEDGHYVYVSSPETIPPSFYK